MAIQAQLYSENLGFQSGVSQDLMDNGCGFNQFCFNLQQRQQQQQKQLQSLQQRNQDLCFENSILLRKNNYNNPEGMVLSQGLSVQIDKQREEIDRFISLQNERLRLALQEQRKQLLVSILKTYESKTQILLRQKDDEIAKAVNRTMELQDFLRRMEMENQTWQRIAKENEEMVVSLNNKIEQMRENSCFSTNGNEDAESCCDVIEKIGQTGENRGQQENEEEDEQRKRKMICKSCNSGNSCFIFLPCRHLCSCQACEAFLDSCPVCGMVKKASVEVLI